MMLLPDRNQMLLKDARLANIAKKHAITSLQAMRLAVESEIARASTILAKFRGNEQGTGLYPHTIRTHEAAEWPSW